MKDELFSSARESLGQKLIDNPTTTPVHSPANTSGKVSVSQLPGNLNDIAAKGRITITSGNKETEVSHQSWGGFGKLFNKDVAYILIDKKNSEICKIWKKTQSIRFHSM